jgi:hypothetical protein
MTDSELSAARLQHWHSSARDLRILKWATSTFGVLLIVGLIGVGAARQQIAHHVDTLAETRRQLERHDDRIRANERGADGVQATLKAQAERLDEILIEQRATRELLQQALSRP